MNNNEKSVVLLEPFQRQLLEDEVDKCSSSSGRNMQKFRLKRLINYGKILICPICVFVVICGLLFIIVKGLEGSDSGRMNNMDFLEIPEEEIISEFDTLLVEKGHNITDELYSKLTSKDWRYWHTNSYDESVYVGRGANKGTYKISGEMPASPEKIVEIIFTNYELVPKWSKDIGQTQLLKKISRHTQIGYQKTRSIGPISPRDFITLRHWNYINGKEILLGFQSIDWNLKNLSEIHEDNAVRGYIGTSGSWIRPVEGSGGKSKIDYLLDLNFNLAFFPFKNTFLIGGLEDSFYDLRERIKALEQT